METIQIDILNPKAKKLLRNLADLNLIKINKTKNKSDFSALLKKLRAKSSDEISLDEITAVVKTADDPCPNGFRVPTEAEWQAEIDDDNWSDASDAFSSDLALPVAGYRGFSSGGLLSVGTGGFYWSSTVSGTDARRLATSSTVATMGARKRARGYPVRCLKE